MFEKDAFQSSQFLADRFIFIQRLRENGIVMSDEEFKLQLDQVEKVLRLYRDASEEEIVKEVIKNVYTEATKLLGGRPEIPGYAIGLVAGNYQCEIYDGFGNYEKKRVIQEDTLFDKASIQKLDTQIIVYNLINEGFFSFDDEIKNIDPDFKSLGDCTFRDITTFSVDFRTNGKIDEMTSEETAKRCLYSTVIVRSNNDKPITYAYRDTGMMILKEVAEKVTGKTYCELVDYYITNKLGIHEDYYTLVPESEEYRLTGTPNAKLCLANDPKLYHLGKIHGHAGGFSTLGSQMQVSMGAFDKLLPKDMVRDIYTPGASNVRGLMGNTYTYHPDGIAKSFVDNRFSRESYAVQGSTRTLSTAGRIRIGKIEYLNAATILLNPCSMSLETAYEFQQKLNEERGKREKPLPPQEYVKQYAGHSSSGIETYQMIDPREMIPTGKTTDPLTVTLAQATVQLMYLSRILNKKEGEKTLVR